MTKKDSFAPPDHAANARAAAERMGLDPASLNQLPASPPGHADAAAAMAAPGGLSGLRGVLQDTARDAVEAFRGFRKPRQAPSAPTLLDSNGQPAQPESTHAAPVRPSSMKSVRLSGGDSLGVPLRDLDVIVPAFVRSVGDLTVEGIDAIVTHRPLVAYLLERVVALQPRHAAREAETDPAILAKLLEESAAATVDLRTHIINANLAGDDRALIQSLFREKLREDIQSRCIPAVAAALATWRAWLAPSIRADGGRPMADPTVAASATFRAHVAGITLASLTATAVELAQEPWLYEGQAHARTLEAHQAEQRACIVATETETARATHLDGVRRTTPRAAGLIVASRIVDPRRSFVAFGAGPSEEIRIGNRAYLIAKRRWPASLAMPSATAVRVLDGHELGYEVMGDDVSLELSERAIEHGSRTGAPRWLLDNVLVAARARVAQSVHLPIVSFIDMRDRSEARKRMALFRQHADAVHDIFTSPDPYTAAIDAGVLLHVGICALRLDPVLVASELGKRSPHIKVAERVAAGFEVARSPSTWIFAPNDGVGDGK